MLPKHWWEGRDFARPLLEPPLGSGPYRIERFEAGRGITYARVADYWGRDLPTMKGTNNFDRMRYEYFRDTTVALEAFKAGQIDFRTENIAKEWATAYDFPAVRRGLVKRDEIRHQLPTGMQAFVVNLRRPMFQDARVRRALNEVFDFEWMNQNLFYGSYARTQLLLLELRARLLRPARGRRAGGAGARARPRAGAGLHRGIQAARHRRVGQQPRGRAPRAGPAAPGRLDGARPRAW